MRINETIMRAKLIWLITFYSYFRGRIESNMIWVAKLVLINRWTIHEETNGQLNGASSLSEFSPFSKGCWVFHTPYVFFNSLFLCALLMCDLQEIGEGNPIAWFLLLHPASLQSQQVSHEPGRPASLPLPSHAAKAQGENKTGTCKVNPWCHFILNDVMWRDCDTVAWSDVDCIFQYSLYILFLAMCGVPFNCLLMVSGCCKYIWSGS